MRGITSMSLTEEDEQAAKNQLGCEEDVSPLSDALQHWSNLQVGKRNQLATSIQTPIAYVADAPGGDARLFDIAVVASFSVANHGPYNGREVPQLYLQMPPVAGNPTKILRGFDNLAIRDSETQPVQIHLTRKDISYWDVVQQTWVTPTGELGVHIGASAADIRLTGSFAL
ncbi:hypothetical protein LTR53_012417 [Teratosphaeriaceae sp. CCFEE 6253]|nr:hypothetical protein LTR53_012417 [Teratosphaeriaceae sp. CCFEE 6253]